MKRKHKLHLAVAVCFALICAQFPARAISSVNETHPAGLAPWILIRNTEASRGHFYSRTLNRPVHGHRTGSLRSQASTPTSANVQSLSNSPGQSVTVLPDGRLLLLGGEVNGVPSARGFVKDISTEKIMALPQVLAYARAYHTATVLPDGSVLILGGIGKDGNVLDVAESFDPTTLSFRTLPSTGLVARAHATATLLTNGSLFVVGGVTKDEEITDTAELWNYRTNGKTDLPGGLVVPRRDQTATLLANGKVLLWGGMQRNGMAIPDGEIFDPATGGFYIVSSPPSAEATQGPQVAATIPEDGDQNISSSALIAVRFSEPVRVQTVTISSVILTTPHGALAAKIVPAENGMLAFVTPTEELQAGATYTVSTSGVTDSSNQSLPDASFSFTVAGASQPNTGETGILAGTNSATWSGGPQNSPWKKLPPLKAPPGVTAISGQVLLLDGHPLSDVTLRIGNIETQSDDTGRFLLRNVAAGRLVMVIDGRSADNKGATYPVLEDGVTVTAGQTNVLTYTVWLPVIDVAHQVTIPVPTTAETVVTTPLIPGLEFHIPAGTTITDIDGKVTNKVSITPIPILQPPFPLPAGVNVPVYFTIQPGGGSIWVSPNSGGRDGGWLVYPNSFHEPVGTRFDFWDYDAQQKGWYIYGHGGVSESGQNIIPDPDVVVYKLTGAMIASSSLGPSSGPSWGFGFLGGEPVDLGTGLFVYNKTDLYLPDVIPIKFTRTYRPNDGASRSLGVGTTDDYDIFLVGSDYTYIELVMPDGSRMHCPRISTGTSFADAVFGCNSAPGPFFASKISWNGNGWTLVRRDGMSYKFHDGFVASTARQGTLLSITDRNGNTLTVTRDSNFNATQITSPNGRWIQLSYDANNRITQIQDNIGRTVQYFYDASGRLDKVIDVNGGTWLYTYDANNNMTALVDPRNITYLQNQYDAQNRVVKQILADGVSTYQFAYNPGCVSNCTQISETDVTDPNGSVKKAIFNSPLIFPGGFSTGGTGSTMTFAAGTSLAQTFAYQYQPGTNLLMSFTDPLDRTTSYRYDLLGNVTSITRLSGTSNAATTSFGYEAKFSQITSITDPLGHQTLFAYDPRGNLTAATDPLEDVYSFGYNSEGEVTSLTDPLGEPTSFAYDSGDLASATDALGRTTSFFMDTAGRLISRTDALGQITKYSYNVLNQVTKVTDALGDVTSFSYDANGNLLSVTDPNTHTTTYTPDSMDRLATRTDALGNFESYQYDGNGNLIQFTDRRGDVTKFSYDALNRRTFAGFGYTGSSYESTISYGFDAGNRLTQSVDSVTGTITRSYDGLDDLLSESTPQGSVSYSYDSARRRTGMTVAGQPIVNYSYDAANRLASITRGTSTVSLAYDAVNRRTSLTLPNGIVMTYGYDAASELNGINYQLGQNSLGNLAYAYDLSGHRASVGGSLAATNLPNPISTTAYNADNELTEWGTATPTYDANGNMLSDGTNTYVWNARNQLASINVNGESFQYDAFGRRTAKTTFLGTVNYLYDGLNPVQELSGGAVTANLLTGLGVDQYLQRTDSNGAANFLTDALGSTLALTDDSGNTLAQYTYEPFGNTAGAGSSSNSYQYSGREDDGGGLYFYRNRYYNPALSRFISQDPIGLAGGLNLYAYVNNNPLSFVDPLGLDARGAAPGGDGQSDGGNGKGSCTPGEINKCGANPPSDNPPTSNPPNNNHDPACGNAARDAAAAKAGPYSLALGLLGVTSGISVNGSRWDSINVGGISIGPYPGSPGGPSFPHVGGTSLQAPIDVYFNTQGVADDLDVIQSAKAMTQAMALPLNDALACVSH